MAAGRLIAASLPRQRAPSFLAANTRTAEQHSLGTPLSSGCRVRQLALLLAHRSGCQKRVNLQLGLGVATSCTAQVKTVRERSILESA